MLYASDSQSIGERVRALLLQDSAQIAALETALRAVAGLSPEAAAAEIAKNEELWLGPLVPGFASQSVRELRLQSWRDSKGGLLKWSGLLQPAEGEIVPRLILDRNAPAKERGRISVRWTTVPEDLPVGAIDYRVVVASGEDELAELTIRHLDKRQQQAAFSVEDFEELEGDEKFEAIVRISVIGVEDVAAVTTEAFTLEFGQVPGQLSSGLGPNRAHLVRGRHRLNHARRVRRGDRAWRKQRDRGGQEGIHHLEGRLGWPRRTGYPPRAHPTRGDRLGDPRRHRGTLDPDGTERWLTCG